MTVTSPEQRKSNLNLASAASFNLAPLALAVSLALAPSAHAADGITTIAVPAAYKTAPFVDLRPTDVSDDGTVLVGTLFAEPGNGNPPAMYGFTLAPGGTPKDIGSALPAHLTSSIGGVSDDGKVIAGDFALPGNSGELNGFILENGKAKVIAPSSGNTYVRVTSVSGDGQVVGGYTGNLSETHGYVLKNGTMTSIGTLGTSSETHALSADGSVAVGASNATPAGNFRAVRWTQASGLVSLGALDPNGHSSAEGVSADGSVVVGRTSVPGGGIGDHAYVWTKATGMKDIHDVAGTFSFASGVSGDGLVAVGAAVFKAGNLSNAFRWTKATGMQTVEAWLKANGVAVAPSLQTSEATATNSNGSVVVGLLQGNAGAFLARVGNGTGGGGLINPQEFAQTLDVSQQAAATTARAGVVAMQGAHSRPLSRRVDAGQSTAWLGGDWGQDSQGSRDGDLSLAEVGVGHNFGDFQFNLSVGHTNAYQRQALNGKSAQEGNYLQAEWLIPLLKREHDGLWAVLSGFHHWGEGDIRRGYLNAGVADSSLGSPSSRTWGTSLRFEWDKLINFAGVSANPYVDYSHVSSKQHSYTEAGGAFPALFDQTNEHFNELRYGVDAERPVCKSARVVAVLEGVHRFEDEAASTTATLLGAGGFAVTTPGQRYEQNWLRAGGGVEADVLGGTASVMLNGTTESEMPSYWVAASWRKRF